MTMKSIALSLAAFALWTLPDVAMGQSASPSAYADDRINQLGRSIADIQSRLDQLRKQNQQLQQQMDKMKSSYESRLERLEKGGSAKAPSPRPAQPRP
jgi:TolA-binding protein